MGLAASQARFLALTARKSNIEFEGQQINQERTTLSSVSAGYNEQLQKLTVPTAPSSEDYKKTSYSYKDSTGTTYEITGFSKNATDPTRYDINYTTEKTQTLPSSQTIAFAKDSSGKLINFSTKSVFQKVDLSSDEARKKLKAAMGETIESSGEVTDAKVFQLVTNEQYNHGPQGLISYADYQKIQNLAVGNQVAVTTVHDEDAVSAEANAAKKGLTMLEYMKQCRTGSATVTRLSDDGKGNRTYGLVGTDGKTVLLLVNSYNMQMNNIQKQQLSDPTSYVSRDLAVSSAAFSATTGYSTAYYDKAQQGSLSSTYYSDGSGNYLTEAEYNKYLEEATTDSSVSDTAHYANENATVATPGVATGVQISFDGSRMQAWSQTAKDSQDVTKAGDCIWITTTTTTDNDAYNDAMNKYEYEKSQYNKAQADINSKLSIVQGQDKNLELKLRNLDTDQQAVSTEMDAVKKVADKNVESTFKTFNA